MFASIVLDNIRKMHGTEPNFQNKFKKKNSSLSSVNDGHGDSIPFKKNTDKAIPSCKIIVGL